MLSTIYTLLLGLLCACFIEAGIYAFYPAPKQTWNRAQVRETPTRAEYKAADEAEEKYAVAAEKHSLRHYVMSLLGATILTSISLQFHKPLGLLSDGILLGSVFTLAAGTIFGITGGGRVARFAVATVSLIVTLILGWIEFIPHTG